MVRHSRRVLLHVRFGYSGPHNPGGKPPVWAIPLSLAATRGISFDFFSSRYLDVSVPWVGSFRCLDMTPSGFPHSDIPGSMLACSSPRLNAACHVLHRRHVPRHPPCALTYLTRIPLGFPRAEALEHPNVNRNEFPLRPLSSLLTKKPSQL